MEDGSMSMDKDDTEAGRLGRMRVLRTGKAQGQALTAEALEALCYGADSKTLTDVPATHARVREELEGKGKRRDRAWYKERCEEREAWNEER